MERIYWRKTCLTLGGAALAVLAIPAPANAQVEARLERLEAELRAVQRTVFPGGDAQYFEPEITSQGNSGNQGQVGITGSTLTGVLARIDAIESQLAQLTASSEITQNTLANMQTQLDAMNAGNGGTSIASNGSNTGSQAGFTQPTGVIDVPTSNTSPTTSTNTTTQVEGPSAQRLAQVQEIAKPVTGDQGDDEYVYGFRLWDAGFYPEAQQQLGLFVERYPNHSRTTFGRNLLGRAFLDAGDPRKAATHFFANYQADKQSSRAPDSLLYLAQSMIEINDTRRACIALSEFGEGYPAIASGRLQRMYDGLLGRVDCS